MVVAGLHKLLDISTQFLIARAKAYKEAGANGILLAEPTAGLLSPKVCAMFSDQYVKRIVDAVQDSSSTENSVALGNAFFGRGDRT